MEHKFLREKKGVKSPRKTRNSLKGEAGHRSAAHRLRSVKLVLAGDSASAVARARGDSPRAVSYWVSRYKESGEAGLGTRARSGRPPRLSQPQLRRVRAHVERTGALTGAALAAYVKGEFGVSLTRQQCRRILNRI